MLAETAVKIENPFPGLRPFEPEEDYLFFGREAQTDELLRRLRVTRFLAVVGGSGSGKSSVVRAGLVPSLYGGAMSNAGSSWRVAIFRPGDKPLRNLAQALCDSAHLSEAQGSRDADIAMMETTLRSTSAGLSAAFHHAHLGEQENLLVVADQFEEIFRYRASSDARYSDDAFALVRLLLKAAADPDVRIYVVLTMRSDFIGSCAEFAGLPKAVSNGQFLVPRLSRAELRRAIAGPAGVAGGEIAPRLLVRLLNETGDDPDRLPVLQHALMRSWGYWRDHSGSGPLDIEHYEAVGTMQHALSRHADEAYAELKSDEERRIAESTFRALVETDEKGRLTRRPSTVEQIAAIANVPTSAVEDVVEHFRAPGRGFIIRRDDSFLDLSHESLMRIWTRLADWAKQEAEAADLYRRLAKAAELHEQGKESLWTNPQLELGLQWKAETRPTQAWAERYAPGFDRASRFLEQSRIGEQNRRRGKIAAIIGVCVPIVLGFALYTGLTARYNRRLAAANQALDTSNKQLQQQVKSLRGEEATLSAEVTELRDTNSKLLADVTSLGKQAGELAAKLPGLHDESEKLKNQVYAAIDDRDHALAFASSKVSQNDGTINIILSQLKSLADSEAQLAALRDKNLQLMEQIWKRGIPMPEFHPSIQSAGSVGLDSRALPPPVQAVNTSQDAYLQQLLKENADLLGQAQQVSDKNRELQAEADALRQQNDKLKDIAADMRVQIARLDGETRLYTRINALYNDRLTDLQNSTAQISALGSSLASQSAKLTQASGGLSSQLRRAGSEADTLKQKNAQLSQAISKAGGK
jgi:hypothetical protein